MGKTEPQRPTAYAEGKRLLDFHSFTAPQSRDLEEAVLGAIILENEKLQQVLEILPVAECFYDSHHQHVYRAIRALDKAGSVVDLLTVTDEVYRSGYLEAIGGVYYLTKLTMNVVSSAHVEAHARKVMEYYLLREIGTLTSRMHGATGKRDADCFDILEELGREVTKLQVGNIEEPYQDSPELAKNFLDSLDKRQTGEITGVTTGYRELDTITGGWQKRNLIIVAARPAVGKTSFSQALALNAALNDTNAAPVGFFSLEMSADEYMMRFISAMARVEMSSIQKKHFQGDELDRCINAAQRFFESKIKIDDSAGLTMPALRAKARRMVTKDGVRMILVDYLQLMRGDEKRHGNREQEISGITRDLKNLAAELDIPIIALSQLNRGLENRTNPVPKLSDLRESGAIEQDANVVIFLVPNQETDDPALKDAILVNVAKNRQGSVGDVQMYFLKEYQLWLDKRGYDVYTGNTIEFSDGDTMSHTALMREAAIRNARDPQGTPQSFNFSKSEDTTPF